jgi:HD-like signal output (HDOD) protein
VRKKTVHRADPDSDSTAQLQAWQVEYAQELPDVPVLPETLLRLELEVQERSVDLRSMARVVLSDLGATVQVLRQSGLESGCMDSRPARIEDCISSLGASACMDAVAAETLGHNYRYGVVAEIWAHSREIAHYARLVAEDTSDINPNDAYLVGLLHTIGLLPNALAWTGSSRPVDTTLAGLQMARQWSFPNAVVDYFRALHRDESAAPWPEIVHQAHRLASRSSLHCPLEQEMRPQLYRAV